jgi:hypothetical protein
MNAGFGNPAYATIDQFLAFRGESIYEGLRVISGCHSAAAQHAKRAACLPEGWRRL